MDNKTLIIIGIAVYFLWKKSQKKNTDNTDDSGSGTSVEQDSGDGSDDTTLDDVMVETHTGGGDRIINNGGSNAIRNGGGNTAKQDFRVGMLR